MKFHLIGPIKLNKDEFEQTKLVYFKLNFHHLRRKKVRFSASDQHVIMNTLCIHICLLLVFIEASVFPLAYSSML